ncbi:ThuA domain-containing protein [Membranihabitans maritimus]|uniref:ThuA domain-containing protein n=1 Tax=Membranihabitans maritimus TaxID=2904244 RepID=UPI001F326E97|nr:ThuA domain-containing protein [Membranihabitans maritimus]
MKLKYLNYVNVQTIGILKFLQLLVLIVAFQAPIFSTPVSGEKKHIVFLISEDVDNYEAHLTIPSYAKRISETYGYKTTVILGKGDRTSFHFSGLDILEKTDLLVVFCRRVALKKEQMKLIKDYLSQGKPLVGIRTANHAFSIREKDKINEGYEDWWGFVPEILGCENKGYGPKEFGTEVLLFPENNNHSIVQGVEPGNWRSKGTLYLVAPLLDQNAKIYLEGKFESEPSHPIAWTRTTDDNSHVFYTSLGHPNDFENKNFIKILDNGIKWALGDLNK